MRTLIHTLLTLALACSTTAAEDWPAWRGLQGNGISRESQAPLYWSSTSGIAWKTPLEGVGLSSPIVVGDFVFVTSAHADQNSRHLVCLERTSGRILWSTPVFQGKPGTMHKFNTAASSTPVANGDRVFACFTDDAGLQVCSVDFDGQPIWSHRVGTFFSNHGFAASPILCERGLVVNGQQDGSAFVVMLDRASGEEIWRYVPDVSLRSFSTPVLTEFAGQSQLIVTGSTQTIALDPNTGAKIWSATGPTEKFVCTPSVGHGMVFSFGGSPVKKAMAVRLGGTGDVSSTHIAWRNERAMPYVPSPLLVGDELHIVNDQGIYTCLEPVSGQVLTTGRKFGPVYSSPVSAAGRIYLFEDSGACTVIQSGRDFKELARNELDETVQTTPAISGGNLFVRGESHLYCISGAPKNDLHDVSSESR